MTTPAPSAERTARITWSLIAEPSDALAMALCTVLGPCEALSVARAGTDADVRAALADRLPAESAEPGGPDPAVRARRGLRRWRARLDAVDLDHVLEEAARRGITVLTPLDEQWPRSLDDLQATRPHCLWLRGPGRCMELFASRHVALVGSRASTPYGEDVASSLAAAFAARGGTVVSGGAYGIDAAAHRGALAGEDGATVAVLAGGLDSLYPRGNTRLLEQIGREHLLISEVPPATAPTRWRFLARNRLIAALSQAVIVVEASWRSGALSTARLGDQLSRPIGAVPGPVSSAASAGCHRLIRERGAVLITEPDDVLDLLPGGPAAGESGFAVQDELDLLSPADRRVRDAVPPRSWLGSAQIAREIGFSIDEVTAALARLELLGVIETRAGKARRAAPAR